VTQLANSEEVRLLKKDSKEAFSAIDNDGSGTITKAEMARFIQKMM